MCPASLPSACLADCITSDVTASRRIVRGLRHIGELLQVWRCQEQANLQEQAWPPRGYRTRRNIRRTRTAFHSPEAVIYLHKAIAAYLKELGKTSTVELRSHRATLERTEQRIAALIQLIAGGDESPYVRTALRDLEARAKAEKATIAALLASTEGPIVLPSPDEVRRRGLRLKELLHGEPMAARSALSRLFNGQRLVVHPQPDRSYVVEGQYFPLLAISDAIAHKSPTPRPSAEAWYSVGCAGRI